LNVVDKISLLETVADRWNSAGIPYAVAHGLEGYPDRVGRDFDVLIPSRHGRHAIELAHEILQNAGLIVVRPPRLWGERLVAAGFDPQPELLELHTVDEISWGFAPLVGQPTPTIRVGPFAVDPWATFVKRVLLRALAGQTTKLRSELSRYPLLESERASARTRLPELMGLRLAVALVRALDDPEGAGLETLIPQMRQAVTMRMWTRRPAAAFTRAGIALWRRLRQPFSACAPVISVVGPPDSGREALVAAICAGDRLIFTRCITATWVAPIEAAVSRTQHWVRLTRYMFRGSLRSLVTDRLRSSRQELVVYDGSALDLVIHPRRFGLRSASGSRLCSRLVAKPDLTILLEGGALRERTPALPASRSEVDLWMSHLADEPSAVVLSTERPLGELRDTAVRLIVRAFVEKNRRPSPA
jgi:hypothetical protein